MSSNCFSDRPTSHWHPAVDGSDSNPILPIGLAIDTSSVANGALWYGRHGTGRRQASTRWSATVGQSRGTRSATAIDVAVQYLSYEAPPPTSFWARPAG
jgi:hypothetical protein